MSEPSSAPDTPGATLDVSGLSKHFGGVRALDGVDLTIASGEVVGLIGPNGSGKTTLVNCVSGVLAPSAGTIALDGRNITGEGRATRARRGLVRTYQNLRLFAEMTVAENIEVAARMSGAGRQSRAFAEAEVERHGLGDVARVPAGELSYGTQRRVEIARALVERPRLLALDEPAAGLGEEDTRSLIDTLRAFNDAGGTVLLVDHDMHLVASVCHRVVVLHEGRVLTQGTPAVVLADPNVAEVYLGSAGRS